MRRCPASKVIGWAGYFVVVGLLSWVAATTALYAFRHPWKTQTELFLEIPRAFVLTVEEVPGE